MNDDMRVVKEQQALDVLFRLGWKLGYVSGHGDDEPVYETIDGKWMRIGDIEKENVLVPPRCLYDKPVEDNW